MQDSGSLSVCLSSRWRTTDSGSGRMRPVGGSGLCCCCCTAETRRRWNEQPVLTRKCASRRLLSFRGSNEIMENSSIVHVVLDGWPSKVVSNRDDGSYATKDLWERHPDFPAKNAWRFYARRDDTIVLSNGETLVQYYVPYLSAIQIFTSNSSANSLRYSYQLSQFLLLMNLFVKKLSNLQKLI